MATKMQQLQNLTDTRLEDFHPGQSLYVQRNVGGFSWNLLCEFVSLRGRLVDVIVREGDPAHSPHLPFPRDVRAGATISVLRRACFLWGQREGDRLRCHWHDKDKGWS